MSSAQTEGRVYHPDRPPSIFLRYFFYARLRLARLHPYNLSAAYRKRNKRRGETAQSHPRRLREGFFEHYCAGRGIDVGCGAYDRVTPDAEGWDKQQGDATFMAGIAEGTYDYVYSSHCLEHIMDQATALRNWTRILKRGGFLIIAVPHRDLYEKRSTLPSRWNKDHKRFYLPDDDEPPVTVSLRRVIDEAIGHQT